MPEPGRRAPRWLVEVTAWSLAAVVTVAGAVVALGVIAPRDLRTVEQVQTPVVERSQVRTVRVPVTSRVASGATRRGVRVGPSLEQLLGPPPGPVVDATPSRTAAPTDRYAFLFGVSGYHPPTHPTIGGANDVRTIAALLEQQGWLASHIRVATDEDATAAALRSGMAWLAGQSRAGATFSLFHYSGHVYQQGNGHVALWPVDDQFVPDNQVAAALGQIRGKAWVDVAGCEAGAFLAGLPTDDVLVSASSAASQKSYEYPDWAMSVWSGLVFQLALGQGDAAPDASGQVTVGSALRYATYYAQAVTLNQTPYGRQTPQVAGDPVRGWTLAAPPA